MDLSSNRSQDEDRIMQRQLYRAGQNQPAAKAAASAPARSTATKAPAKGGAKPNGKSAGGGERILLMILLLGVGYYLLYGNPDQRKKAYIGLGVAGWLLLLGGISYWLCLPNLEAIQRERKAIFEDKSLTREEKFEKLRELESSLSSSQRRDLRKLDRKAFIRKNNSDIYTFLQKTPEEQVAQLKKEAAEREKRMQEWAKQRGNRPPWNRNNDSKNNGNNNNNRGGGPPGGGFGGGGGGNRDVSMLESGSSPEARAGNLYKRALSQQLGLNSGFGPRGGGGGKR
jgi:uncharacterized membrane protein YgcG